MNIDMGIHIDIGNIAPAQLGSDIWPPDSSDDVKLAGGEYRGVYRFVYSGENYENTLDGVHCAPTWSRGQIFICLRSKGLGCKMRESRNYFCTLPSARKSNLVLSLRQFAY
jgi:hypothetical protein